MDALILAGGVGSRLRPITDYVPKSLIPISNVPILEWQIRYLVHYGVRRIIVCAGYRHEEIENFIDARGKLGAKIVFSTESAPLGTGGAIKKAEPLLRADSALVINGDVITNIDLGKISKVRDSIAAVNLRTKYGVLDIDNDTISAFSEKKVIGDMWMNAGIYHLSRKTMRSMPRRGNAESTLFPKMAARRSLQVMKFARARWYSIDSHKDLTECASQINAIMPKN